MKRLQDLTGDSRYFEDPAHFDTSGLMKTGVLSLLFHMVLVIFLILYLKLDATKNSFAVYRVSLRPASSVSMTPPAKTQNEKGENRSSQEIKRREPIYAQKDLGQTIPSPEQPGAIEVTQEEKEGKLKESIPLPMSEVSSWNPESNSRDENNLPILSSPSYFEEKIEEMISGIGSGEGSGAGPKGHGWERAEDGVRGVQGDSSRRGLDNNLEVGHGNSPWGGFGRGQGVAAGSRGSGGPGNGTGQGHGGAGSGTSGNVGLDVVHPRHAPKPVYPLEARKKGYEGKVLLRVEILQNGQVGRVEVKTSSGYEVLDESALVTLKEWKFHPTGKKGPVYRDIPIRFQLL